MDPYVVGVPCEMCSSDVCLDGLCGKMFLQFILKTFKFYIQLLIRDNLLQISIIGIKEQYCFFLASRLIECINKLICMTVVC